MKRHARKDENGIWRDEEGCEVGISTSDVVFHYGHKQVTSKRTTSTISSSRPHVSKNMAIHADQVRDFNKKAGPGVQYDTSGVMHSTSYAAREREARRRDMSFG